MPPTNYTPAGGLTECLVLSPTLSSHEGCSRVVPPFPSFLSARRCHSQQQHRHLTRMVEEERADNHNPRAKHPCSVPSSAGFGNPPCSGHVRASTDVVTDRRQKRSRSPPEENRERLVEISRLGGRHFQEECCPRPAGGLVLAAQQCFGHEAVVQRQSLGFQNGVRRESQRASRAHGCAI